MPNPAKYLVTSQRDAIGLFFQIYEQAVNASWVSELSNTFTSNQSVETYAGIGNAPALREWVGGRLAKSLAEYSRTVTNKDYEATLEVFRKDIKRDKTGQLAVKIMGLAQRAAEHDEKLLSGLIDVGTGSTLDAAYDGQHFFDTDHSVGSSGTMDNDIVFDISDSPSAIDGTASAPSPENFAFAYLQAVKQLQTFKDDQGEPINHNMQSVVVMVPTGMAPFARAGLFSETFGGGATNPAFAARSPSGAVTARLVVNPRLTWTESFAVFRSDSPTKPYLIQIEESPVMEIIGEGSEYAFDHAAHKYGVRKSGAVASWDFTKACYVTLQA
jgi:hypothetical protein